MRKNQPIGVFDSGFGGFSVYNHLRQLMPNENFIYIADSSWCPYGERSYEEVRSRAVRITEYLIQRNAKIIVVACNTATAAAIELLRRKFPKMTFVGMEPAIKPAAKLTNTNVVGVLATQNTFNGQLYKETKKKYAGHIRVVVQIGFGLVELVENNQTRSPEAIRLLEKYIQPMREAGADYLVLGCTHYPFLLHSIKIVAPQLNVIDPALPVAKRVLSLLSQKDLLNDGLMDYTAFYTTGALGKLNDFARAFVTGNYITDALQL
ncbi:MAG: glutamate racemase [Salinivirgaceae bacterium]|jgi:glutamate racemase|nr:glutamate racemase [Salinivirgaceae bacterium]